MPPRAATVRLEIEPRDFADEFRALTLVNSDFAKRPGYGQVGTKLNLLANVYPLKFNKPIIAHHYDILITAVPRAGKSAPTGDKAREQERQLPLKLCRQIFNALPSLNPELATILAKAAYDGRKSVFTPIHFPFKEGSATYEVQLQPTTDTDKEPRSFNIKISHAQSIDLSVLARYAKDQSLAEQVAIAIQAIDVLLRHDPSNRTGVIIAGQGRKFLNSTGINATALSSGAQLLRGFFQSVRPSALGPVVNIDTAASPYIASGNLLAVCNAIVGRGGGGRGGGRGGRGGRGGGGGGGGGSHPATSFDEREIRELKSRLRGGKVRVTHRVDRKEYIIDGFGSLSSQQIVSINDKGPKRPAGMSAIAAAAAAAEARQVEVERPAAPASRMTVDQYFKTKYNIPIPNPSYQCIRLKNGTYVPISVLDLLPGLSIPPTKLTRDQAQEMIRETATRPEDRKKAIDIVRVENDFNRNARLASWEISVASEMAPLVGRGLPPPKVNYRAGPGATPNVAAGAWNLTASKFLGPNKPLQHWAVINFAPRMIGRDQLQNFVTTLVNQCVARGMSINNKQPTISEGNVQDLSASIRAAAKSVITDAAKNPGKLPPQLLVFVIQDPHMYPDLKRISTMDFPVPIVTQVLLAKNLVKDRGIDQYCGNVSMKLNVKLFGYNCNVAPADVPKLTARTIMIGADVTHPPNRGSDIPAPSIAALVATRNSTNTTYECQVREQEGRKEIITDLADMAKILMEKWINKSNKVKPDVILFFRDGVSEGQYAAVVYEEITALKAAVKAIDPKWNPKISYVVCAKRHNIRFFAAAGTRTDKTGNLQAGTVVDTTVVNPYLFDFYLQAHSGLVGTARPTHYIVLLDENGFTADQMQKLVNSLCYTFARATRSVSLVPVAYYADILATLARNLGSYDDDTSSVSSGNTGVLNPRRIQDKLDLGGELPMFFM